MSTDEFTPDLSSLAGDYQILTPLRRSATSQTLLARNLKLNRDVTITVVRVPGGDTNNSLTHFATDARTLSVMRHRNVVPVIEGRWLADGAFAIVRARVRGTTVDQLLSTSGSMPLPRVASTLEQVYAAIEWARANGIVHRHVSRDAIVYQQGSGRVLLELDPAPLGAGAFADACDDARTMGRLAYEMLTGKHDTDSAALPLGQARPDLSPAIVRETEALMACESRGEPRDAVALIALLGGRVQSPVVMPPKKRVSASPILVQTGPLDSAVVVVKRPFGFNARVTSAVAVLAIVGGLGFFLMNRRDGGVDRTAANTSTIVSEAAGEVALPPRSDTFTVSSPAPIYVPPPPVSRPPQIVQPMPSPVTTPMPAVMPETSVTRLRPPETRRPEPPRPMTPRAIAEPTLVVQRDSVVRDSVVVRDTASAKPVVPADDCDSIEPLAQARCFNKAVERSDQGVNNAYQRLITALRREANVQPSDPDPESVDALREAQRRWTETRDAACRDAGGGLLYARARAQCVADQAARRRDDLLARLAGMP